MDPITRAYLNEAVKMTVIVFKKEKKFIVIEDSNWRRFSNNISGLLTVLEGTGSNSIETGQLSQTGIDNLIASSYQKINNMTLTAAPA